MPAYLFQGSRRIIDQKTEKGHCMNHSIRKGLLVSTLMLSTALGVQTTAQALWPFTQVAREAYQFGSFVYRRPGTSLLLALGAYSLWKKYKEGQAFLDQARGLLNRAQQFGRGTSSVGSLLGQAALGSVRWLFRRDQNAEPVNSPAQQQAAQIQAQNQQRAEQVNQPQPQPNVEQPVQNNQPGLTRRMFYGAGRGVRWAAQGTGHGIAWGIRSLWNRLPNLRQQPQPEAPVNNQNNNNNNDNL